MYTRGALLLCLHRQRENYQDTGSLVCTSGGLSRQVGLCSAIHLSIILTIQPIHPCIYLFNLFTNNSLAFIRLSFVMFNLNSSNIHLFLLTFYSFSFFSSRFLKTNPDLCILEKLAHAKIFVLYCKLKVKLKFFFVLLNSSSERGGPIKTFRI